MSKVKVSMFAAMAVAAAASASQAAVIPTLVPVVTAEFAANPDGTLGAQVASGLSLVTVPNTSTPLIYQVTFMMTQSGNTSTNWLDAVAFGLDGIQRGSLNAVGTGAAVNGLLAPPGATNTDSYGDTSGNPVLQTTPAGTHGLFNALVNDGNTPAGYFYEDFQNGPTAGSDFGGANGDAGQLNLEAVTYSQKAGTTVKKTLGATTPYNLGFVDLYWDGTGSQVLALNSGGNSSTLQYGVDTNGVLGNAQFIADTNQVVFGSAAVTPEPASLGVLALGGVTLLARRKKA